MLIVYMPDLESRVNIIKTHISFLNRNHGFHCSHETTKKLKKSTITRVSEFSNTPLQNDLIRDSCQGRLKQILIGFTNDHCA